MKATKIIGSILLGTGIGLIGFLITLQNGLLGQNIRAFTVTSGSMEPTIHVGSVVFTKSSQEIADGDIISFKVNGNPDDIVTHRVLTTKYNENNEPYYLTAGDANEDVDTWEVKPSHIIGKTFLTAPYLGYFANFVKTPRGFVAFIVIPSSIIIYEELKVIAREIKKIIKNALPSSDRGDSVKSIVFMPIIAISILFTGITKATFSDSEVTNQNTLSVASEYYSPTSTPSPSPTPTPEPSPTPEPEIVLKINEFSPSPSDEVEWVEIYNAGNVAIDLTNWKLKDAAQSPKVLSGTIQPNEFYVYDDGNGWLNNGGDTINLLDPTDTTVDSYTYGSTDADVTVGRETDGNDPFKKCTTPTKGTTNNGSC